MQIKLDDDHTITINHWPETFPDLLNYHIKHFGNHADYQHLNQLVANNKNLTIWERWIAYLIINCRAMVKIAFRTHHDFALYHLTDFLTFIVETPPKSNIPVTTAIGQKLTWFNDYYYTKCDVDFISQVGQANVSNNKLDQDTINQLKKLPVSLQNPVIGRKILSQLHTWTKHKTINQEYIPEVYDKYRQLGSYIVDHKHRELNKRILSHQYNYLHDHTILVDPTKLNRYLDRHQIINEIDPYRYHDDIDSLRSVFNNLLKKPGFHGFKQINILKLHTYTDQPLNLDQIGEKYELSRERVRQIENLALRKLRYQIHEDYWTPQRQHNTPYSSPSWRFKHRNQNVISYYHSFLTDERHFDDRQVYLYGNWLTH